LAWSHASAKDKDCRKHEDCTEPDVTRGHYVMASSVEYVREKQIRQRYRFRFRHVLVLIDVTERQPGHIELEESTAEGQNRPAQKSDRIPAQLSDMRFIYFQWHG